LGKKKAPKSQPNPNPPDRSKITYTVPRKKGPTRSSLPKTRQVTVKTGRGR